jgi:enoyl-CoA hydratase/carnithine racemase
MFERFAAAVDEASSDGTRVMIITGAGEAFCSGLDLASIGPEELAALDVASKLRGVIHPPIRALRTLPVPVITRIHGPAVGIGFSYVLASDIRIASESAQFSQSFVRIGLMPDGGSTFFLPRLVGYARAFELMTTGAPITAQQALALGVVNRVVSVEALDRTVDDLALRLAASPQPSVARIKAALVQSEADALDAALEMETQGQTDCFGSSDFVEGMTAFKEKRTPVFGKG